MEEISLQSANIPWEASAEYPSTLRRKVLRTGADGKPRVALIRLEPGFEGEGHTHALAESHYVLEGMYESHGKEFASGAYRFVPKHTHHGPFHSAGGAVVLVFWED
jgi:anti-sigma factor ChrR (cupin superfamily)